MVYDLTNHVASKELGCQAPEFSLLTTSSIENGTGGWW